MSTAGQTDFDDIVRYRSKSGIQYVTARNVQSFKDSYPRTDRPYTMGLVCEVFFPPSFIALHPGGKGGRGKEWAVDNDDIEDYLVEYGVPRKDVAQMKRSAMNFYAAWYNSNTGEHWYD